MDITKLERVGSNAWRIPATGAMRVPGVIFADEELVVQMDEKVGEQLRNVASLPGIQDAAYAMPDAHWGYGFPIGGVAAFDPEAGGVISAGGVGFDISCGVRTLHTGLKAADLTPVSRQLADALFAHIPAGMGHKGDIRLSKTVLRDALLGGARWAVENGYGTTDDLNRIEDGGRVEGALPEFVSDAAFKRQRPAMGTLGSGNHYLEVQIVEKIYDAKIATGFDLAEDDVLLTIHCGSRGLGHQIASEFLTEMVAAAADTGLSLPDRDLAYAPIRSELGARYIGAMRAAINCALANRQILTDLSRKVFTEIFPESILTLLYDVSHNTCKEEPHMVNGKELNLFVHRKGATRSFGPGHAALPDDLRALGQPVLVGGSMGTASHILAGAGDGEHAFGSACHGAGRKMSRRQAARNWHARQLKDELAKHGILIRSASWRGIVEEAPGAYKDVDRVAESTEQAGLARRVARLRPVISIKG